MNKQDAVALALQWAQENAVTIPDEIRGALKAKGYIKQADITAINAAYHDNITEILTGYFEGGSVTAPRNEFKKAMSDAFIEAFELGWQDGGQDLPLDDNALDWLGARQEAEFGHIGELFQQAKELRKEEEFDYFAWITARADGYTSTVLTVYNMAKLLASKNKMLTFTGKDGSPDNICQRNNGTCVRLMGQRHRASWWINHDLVPYRGNENYDCGAWECQHYLEDDEGNRFIL